jgi:hypothetical protein
MIFSLSKIIGIHSIHGIHTVYIWQHTAKNLWEYQDWQWTCSFLAFLSTWYLFVHERYRKGIQKVYIKYTSSIHQVYIKGGREHFMSMELVFWSHSAFWSEGRWDLHKFTQVSLPLSFTQVFTQACRWDLHKFTQVSLPLSAYSSQQRERDRREIDARSTRHVRNVRGPYR